MINLKEKYKKIAVLINVRDRPTELAMLLQSLYTQTYDLFDVYVLDDFSGTPLNVYHFLNCIITRLQLSGHKVHIKRTDFPHGVSKARQNIVNWALESKPILLLRIDDDVILESDFIERLVKVIDKGYDLASGVTPPMIQPILKREKIPEIGNRVVLDNEGNYILNNDDFGMLYYDDAIINVHHFRSSALYKSEIHEKVNYTPTKLTKHGFREEQIFSFRCLMEGYKIGVDTHAIAYHMMTPSGGERFVESNELIKQNEEILKEFTKENKDKLNEIFSQPEVSKQEIMKETNLAGKI